MHVPVRSTGFGTPFSGLCLLPSCAFLSLSGFRETLPLLLSAAAAAERCRCCCCRCYAAPPPLLLLLPPGFGRDGCAVFFFLFVLQIKFRRGSNHISQ
jgi:hypothetical protein